MKISFKVLDGNKIASNNNKVLSQYIIDESYLNNLSIIRYNEKAIYEMNKKNRVFVVLPMNGKGSNYRVCDAFVVRRNDGTICVWLWSNQFINFEDGDVIFTTKDEAESLAFELNSVTKNKKVQSELDKDFDIIGSKLDKTQELRDKIAEKIVDFCKDESERLANSATKNKKLQSDMDNAFETIESQLNNAHNLRDKIAAYSKDMDGKEKVLFDAVLEIIDGDVKKLSKSLEQLQMLKYLTMNFM